MDEPSGWVLPRGAFPEQWRNSLINHHSTMHSCGNKLASHDFSRTWSHLRRLTTLVQQHRAIVNDVTCVWWKNNFCYLTNWRSLRCCCNEHGNYWLIYYFLLPIIALWCLIHRRFPLTSYSTVPVGIYAHAHFSKTALTMNEQKYLVIMHLYLDRMEDTDSATC